MLLETNFICEKRFGLLDTRQTRLGGEGTALCRRPNHSWDFLSDLNTTAARLLDALTGLHRSSRTVRKVQHSEQIKVTKQ